MRNALRAAVGVLALALLLPVSARAETWVIDPAHTVSGFTVKHMMIANVTGVFEVTGHHRVPAGRPRLGQGGHHHRGQERQHPHRPA